MCTSLQRPQSNPPSTTSSRWSTKFYEELSTLLCQFECCLNSRPLLPLNSHTDDGVEVLTPGHFVVGRPLHSLPKPDLTADKLPLLKRRSLCEALSQHWWKRWSNEYLQQLQRMAKWRIPACNLLPGAVSLAHARLSERESGTLQ